MVIALLPFWLFGVVVVLFPNAVWKSYRRLHGPDFERRTLQPRHIRNAGIVWLIVMALATYFSRNQVRVW